MCGENKINQNKDANPIKCKMILNKNTNKKSIIFIYDLFLFSIVFVFVVVVNLYIYKFLHKLSRKEAWPDNIYLTFVFGLAG